MIQAATLSRFSAEGERAGNEIKSGDVYIVSDCGKLGNQQPLMNGFLNQEGGHLQKNSEKL